MDELSQLGVGKTKGLIVPKTMYVGNKGVFDRLALLTYPYGRSYREDVVGSLLGCSLATHVGMDIEKVLGRKHGECSVLLESQSLAKFDVIVLSQQLERDLRKASTVVAYCIEGGRYFCVSGVDFMKNYADNLLQGRLTVTQEVFK